MSTTVKPLSFNGGAADDFVIGTALNDFIFGNDGNDNLSGGDGNDSLDGGKGDDILSGGAGRDSLRGGAGNDIYIAGLGSDNFNDVSNDPVLGRDTVDFSQLTTAINVKLGANNFSATTTNPTGVVDTYRSTHVENIIGTAQNDTFQIQDIGTTSVATNGRRLGYEISGGEGADTFTIASKFSSSYNEADMPTVTDYAIGEDIVAFDPGRFSIGEQFLEFDENGEVISEEFVVAALSFQNVARDGEGVDAGLVNVEADHNVYVLQGSFTDAESAADALANALAGGDADEGAGFGVYFDETEQRLRVFSTDDLDNAEADARVTLNLENDLGAEATLALLPTFVASDFLFI